MKTLEAKGQYREALKEYAELLKIANEREAERIRNHVGMMIKNRPYLGELSEEASKHILRAEVSTKEGRFGEDINEYKKASKIAPFFVQLYIKRWLLTTQN